MMPPLRRCLLALLLALAVVAVYQGAWHGGYIWDDDAYVTKNPLLTAPDGLRRIWFSLEAPSQYFPLTYTVLRWERSLWGLNPAGYHGVNIALHIANALLVWWLLARLRTPGAFLAALVFALHPVQVESVAWITELKNLLMGFFFLLTLVSWTFFVNEPAHRRWRFYAAAIFLYVLALFAKSTACTLPAALLLILWLEKKPISKARWGQVAPFVILGVAMGLVAIWWERFHQGTRGALFALSPPERLLVASRAVWFYLGKLFWPADLIFIYPRWSISTSDPRQYAWLAACLLAIPAILSLRRRTGRSLEVAALFFTATLAPVLGFIMLYTFRYTYVADHYQYLACIGPIALASAGLAELTNQRRPLGFGLSAGVIAAFAFLTWRQSATYRDVETLWRTTIARNPDCWMAYNNLGIELAGRGEFDEAIRQYDKSIGLEPGYAQAHYNLGTAFLQKGEVDRALEECRVSLNLQPNDPDACVALGNALLAAGKIQESIAQYRQALNLRPGDGTALYNLGNALQGQGDVEGAAELYRKALQVSPEMIEPRLNLGNLLSQKGNDREAIEQYEKALAFDPHSMKAQNNLAWSLASSSESSLRDGRKAVVLAEMANQSAHGANPLILTTLAAALAESGNFEEAMTTLDRAMALAKGSNAEAGLIEEIERQHRLYKSGQSYRAR
jgi:tetratricopeptide (TPR) repeat protein